MKIESIDYLLGECEYSVEELCLNANRDYERHVSKTGFNKVFRTSKPLSIFVKEFLRTKLRIEKGETIIFVNQSETNTMPGFAMESLPEETESEIAIFELADGCSGFVKALFLAEAIMKNTRKAVYIVTAEKYSQFIGIEDIALSSIFSDSICLTKIVPSLEFRIADYVFLTRSDLRENLRVNDEIQKSLYMNGKEILAWTTASVIPMVKKIVEEKCKVDREEIDWNIHQASKVVVNQFAKEFKLPDYSFNSADIGNTVSSSIPISIKLRDRNFAQNKKYEIYVGFGVGLSAGVVLLEK